MSGRIPDFLIIGAMKSGTTSLAESLSQHPEIFMTEEKELHFHYPGASENLTRKQYYCQFSSSKKLVGSAPQNYSKTHLPRFKNVPESLWKHLPNLKIIYVVRDPLDRIASHYCEHFSNDQAGYGARSVLKSPKDPLFQHFQETSNYSRQLISFLKFFPPSQIHVCRFDQLLDCTTEEFLSIQRFLGVSPHHIAMAKANESSEKRFLRRGIQWLLRKNTPRHYKLRYKLFSLSKKNRGLKGFITSKVTKPVISEECKQFLYDYFMSENKKLEESPFYSRISFESERSER